MATYRLHCRVSPYDYDSEWAAFFEKNKLVPEIYLNGRGLDEKLDGILSEMALWTASKNMRPSIHAPFATADPVLFDAIAKNNVRRMTDKTIALVRSFNAEIVVCHPVFEKYRNRKSYSKWIDANVSYFDHIITQTEEQGTTVAVENIYDERPDMIADLMKELKSARFMFCFDIGHYNKYSKVGLSKWFKALGGRLCEVHVHDNSGKHDEHLPPGEGTFPFNNLAAILKKLDRDVVLTVETLRREDASRAIDKTKSFFGMSS
jgi:sugar phosphate isomerase/epimerase